MVASGTRTFPENITETECYRVFVRHIEKKFNLGDFQHFFLLLRLIAVLRVLRHLVGSLVGNVALKFAVMAQGGVCRRDSGRAARCRHQKTTRPTANRGLLHHPETHPF